MITHSVNSTAAYKDVFEVFGNAVLTIEGEGSVIAEDGYSVYAAGNSKVNLNGGYYFSPVTTVDARKNAIVTINGGEFKVDGANNSDGDYGRQYTLNLRDKTGNYAGELADIIVKGGKFYKYNPAVSESENPHSNFVAPGFSSVADGDYFVAKGGLYNEIALKTAIASGFKQVALDSNIDLTSSLEVSSNLDVNLNGKEIKCASSDVFVVTNGILTIDGEGLVYGSERNEGNSCAVWVNGANAKAIIKNGTYKVGGDIHGTTDQRNDCIYVGKDGGTIEIHGGVFEYTGDVKDGSINDGSRFLVNQNNDHATQLITVYGGAFHNFDPAKAKTDEPWMTGGVGSFVADGYSSVKDENNIYVVK